jgi:hypothetical protein
MMFVSIAVLCTFTTSETSNPDYGKDSWFVANFPCRPDSWMQASRTPALDPSLSVSRQVTDLRCTLQR